MKLQRSQRNSGFTLIEMIGVLAIIALLAGMLVPRIVQAIKEARIQSTVVSINTLKAAVAQYYAKHGTLANLSDVDTLVTEGFLDKGLDVKVGSSVTFNNTGGSSAAGSTPKRYNLDGDTSTPGGTAGAYDTYNAAHLIEVKIDDVSLEDAYQLSLAIDGSDLSTEPSSGNSDTEGRVVYDFGTSGEEGSTTLNKSGAVYIYIAHE